MERIVTDEARNNRGQAVQNMIVIKNRISQSQNFLCHHIFETYIILLINITLIDLI